ncbi:hypothetical protein L905_27555 [Agrobacterium sp. TS43]|nr:hypothetical protein L902_30695 [Agrobacterium radiobacter DSM 30147]KDR88681.1 hypothetical protein K538_21930 [Agrobacterium tumefaciens GW4]KVK43614.1 hypothetical protein L904_27190 [Agrobacterium sp. LY4]KVK43645.1 hypothetical protein L903_27215 [Agrobacterium sp. JL28]KVK57627.1 hypothetical protein L906_27120 [Agrobacterium sp. TS45]KVK61029.1 hypothetical protein L907_26995 [Agrobacterium sp. C13]KVK70394.1 hypothetical protein L905_27555 [Agrobacterium sp. TS43]
MDSLAHAWSRITEKPLIYSIDIDIRSFNRDNTIFYHVFMVNIRNCKIVHLYLFINYKDLILHKSRKFWTTKLAKNIILGIFIGNLLITSEFKEYIIFSLFGSVFIYLPVFVAFLAFYYFNCYHVNSNSVIYAFFAFFILCIFSYLVFLREIVHLKQLFEDPYYTMILLFLMSSAFSIILFLYDVRKFSK